MKLTNGNTSRKPWVLFGKLQSRTEVQVVPVWLEQRADREESGGDPYRANCPPMSRQVCVQAQPACPVDPSSLLPSSPRRQRWKNKSSHQLRAFALYPMPIPPMPSLVRLPLEEPFVTSTANSSVTFLQTFSLMSILVIPAGLLGLNCHHRVSPHHTSLSFSE